MVISRRQDMRVVPGESDGRHRARVSLLEATQTLTRLDFPDLKKSILQNVGFFCEKGKFNEK